MHFTISVRNVYYYPQIVFIVTFATHTSSLNRFRNLMLKVYGINNCDTVQKALKWLDKNKVKYTFHDYKVSGIDKATIDGWLKQLPVDKVINLRSTTYKELPEEDRGAINDKSKAIALMMKYNSIIKRPLWDFGNGTYFLGWDEKKVSELV